MGVGDLGEPRRPFLTDEVSLIRRALADDRPALGVPSRFCKDPREVHRTALRALA
jgi:hypothetical protein